AAFSAARRAPSWENAQPWHFILVRDQAVKDLVMQLSGGQRHAAKAPVLVACLGNVAAWKRENMRERLKELRDAGAMNVSDDIIEKAFLSNPMFSPGLRDSAVQIARTVEAVATAMSFFLIEATNQGLGACIIGAFGNELTGALPETYAKLRTALQVPDDHMVVAFLTVGIPAETPPARPRRSLGSLVSTEKFGVSAFQAAPGQSAC
ncbi:MAG: nitroreductase family protein, partial [Planctomycetota bacterium]|nr:nitroreductase family protein [Planctomycetota bacterium]